MKLPNEAIMRLILSCDPQIMNTEDIGMIERQMPSPDEACALVLAYAHSPTVLCQVAHCRQWQGDGVLAKPDLFVIAVPLASLQRVLFLMWVTLGGRNTSN